MGEIGVYAGRLFILMKLSGSEEDPSFAIDLFHSQGPTDGGPQCVSVEQFLANVERCTGSAKKVFVLEQASQNVAAERILDACGLVRMISIDGEHSFSAVISDLNLAERITLHEGVVMLDDMYNPDWPDVAIGTARYLSNPDSCLRPFAITPNKVFLARVNAHAAYQEKMRKILRLQHSRTTTMVGCRVEVFTK